MNHVKEMKYQKNISFFWLLVMKKHLLLQPQTARLVLCKVYASLAQLVRASDC